MRIVGIVFLIALLLLGCAAAVPPAENPAPAAPYPALLGVVRDAVGIRRFVTPAEVVPEAPRSVFGILSIDSAENPRFVPAIEVPNVENQTYGWFIWVGDSTQPVRWTATFTRSDAYVSGDAVEPEASIFNPEDAGSYLTQDGTSVRRLNESIAPDGRSAITEGESVPVQGFISHAWRIEAGTPPGRYQMAVAVSDGRTEVFPFILGQPRDADQSAGFCPYVDVYLDWWWAKLQPGGDPSGRDLSGRVMTTFGIGLLDHGFILREGVEDAYWQVTVLASKTLMDQEMAHGYVRMRAVADFQGKVRRYTHYTPGETFDYGVLFEKPISDLDAYIRGRADDFADKLLPHARHMCADWTSGRLEEQARLERIRAKLTEEIERVRRARAEWEHRKTLEIEIEPPSAP
jgi:hypothetical protein